MPIRGCTPVKNIGSGYCPKCGMWGQYEYCELQLPPYYCYSTRHVDRIEGKQFTTKRCYYFP